MKVRLTNAMKRVITLAEAPAVRQIISDCKEDNFTPTDYAAIAARAISDNNNVKVLEANAEICKNSKVWNRHTNNSECLDVWVNFTAMVDNGFIVAGAYLSDIWDISSDKDANNEMMKRWYIRKFKEVC